MINKPTSTSPYSSAARVKFEALKKLYASNNNFPPDEQASFWKLGNSFDTMIDFLDAVDNSSAHEVAQMAVTQLEASLKHIGGGFDGAWFDDFGWWSVAAQRALSKPFFKPDAKQFQKILNECWPRFTGNAPYVWDRRQPGTFEDYGPAVAGGVWNAYWLGTSNKYPGPKDGDPSSGTLVGIQNTVTNALYLMAVQRLGPRYPDAWKAAQKEFQFLQTWLDEGQSSLWWQVDSNAAALVRERVGHFANGKRAPGFQDDWAWTGDQGLVLGGLSDAMIHQPPGGFRRWYLDHLTQLLSGVSHRLVDDEKVVQPYTSSGYLPDGDKPDYETGPGVFWRNVLHVWNTNSDLQPALASPEFQAIVRASADAAAQAPTSDANGFDDLTNQTAILVVAVAMLK